MEILKAFNSGLAFLLELAMLAAFSYWGFFGDKSIWVKWTLGIGVPLVAVVIWGYLLAPKSGHRLGVTWGTILSSALFLTAALALYQTGQSTLAIALALIVIINRGLILLWKQTR